MPKYDAIEARLIIDPPPSTGAARQQRAAEVGQAERAEEVDRDDFLEHVGVVLAAPAGEVLARVVHEHVERSERGIARAPISSGADMWHR